MLLCFKIRVIRAIRVVSLHHEYPESHECCCFFKIRVIRAIRVRPRLFFTTNISNLTNAAVSLNSCNSCDSWLLSYLLHHEYLESHECCSVFRFV